MVQYGNILAAWDDHLVKLDAQMAIFKAKLDEESVGFLEDLAHTKVDANQWTEETKAQDECRKFGPFDNATEHGGLGRIERDTRIIIEDTDPNLVDRTSDGPSASVDEPELLLPPSTPNFPGLVEIDTSP
ncbi:hypothetical protein K435DRAFT_860026 [Dendrothele bispora CBS 962.96]|uniref:Uncharacterized protein n=1 Tax=Dendrothele bispora (strain CBS 962.96) TaxID=1314807 RepID=A0A4S8LZ00_DENBC|nr:hypothetical protein K435DRAFT_860026 [Dendrothele bispora CBS 962.96]